MHIDACWGQTMADIYSMVAFEYESDIFNIDDDGRVEDASGETKYDEGKDTVRMARSETFHFVYTRFFPSRGLLWPIWCPSANDCGTCLIM